MKKLFSQQELACLPLGFQFFTEQVPLKKPDLKETLKVTKIDFYQTDQYQTYNHYKPISKIVVLSL
jgi:hypothetical protein